MWYLCCGCSDTSSCESTSTVHRVKCDVNRSLCYGAGAPFQRGEVCEDDVVGVVVLLRRRIDNFQDININITFRT